MYTVCSHIPCQGRCYKIEALPLSPRMEVRIIAGFPLGLENLEKWEGIFQSGNFEQTGKVRENHTKYWKTQGIRGVKFLFFSYFSQHTLIFPIF